MHGDARNGLHLAFIGGTWLTLLRGTEPVEVLVDGTPVTVRADRPATAPLREAAPLLAEPTQPVGRAPRS